MQSRVPALVPKLLLVLIARRSKRAPAVPLDQQEVAQQASSPLRSWLVKTSSQASSVARVLIWGVSLLVIVVSLLNSHSRSSPGEFASRVQSSSFETSMNLDAISDPDGSIQQMDAADRRHDQAATVTLGDAPDFLTETEVAPAVSPSTASSNQEPACAAEGDLDCNCADFLNQVEAQRFFERFLPADPHSLDVDGDGVACEWITD